MSELPRDETERFEFFQSLAERASFDEKGRITVVVQDVVSAAVLMVAWADREAIEATGRSGLAHFHSRSRDVLWCKGETSGNTLRVVEAQLDCDGDTLLLRAHPRGPTCHTGNRSCFHPNPARLELGWLFDVLTRRRESGGDESYTARLLAAGRERVAQKVGEEAIETVVAAVAPGPDFAEDLVEEAADLLYHLEVLLLDCGVDPGRVAEVLAARAGSRPGADE